MSNRKDPQAPPSDSLETARPTAPPQEDAHRWAQADALYREARSLRQRDLARLKSLAEESLSLARQVGVDGESYRAGIANALSMLAYCSAMQGESETALSQSAQAIALLDSAEPSTVLGDVYEAMGQARFCQGAFIEAIDVLERALDIARVTGDRSLEAFARDSASCINSVTGHWDEAIAGHLEALAIQQELGDELNVALVLNNLAYSYAATGQFESALEAATSALRYVEANNLPHSEMAVLDTVANVYLAVGELDTAGEYATRSLSLAREHQSWRGGADALITLGRIELKRQHYDEALDTIRQALTFAEAHDRAVEEYTCHELLSQIHEQRGDAAAALVEYRRFHELAQIRISEESATRLAQMGVEHQLETARKNAEIHRLRSLALEREVEERRLAQAHLEADASLDPLTGLYNRRHLSVVADKMQAALERGEPVSLILFDIDRFKEVNDSFGHLAGDRVLVSVALQLTKNCRVSDVPCRYGGDEFLVLLVGMDSHDATEAAERLRAAVEVALVESNAERIEVTISAGVACARSEGPADLPSLVERADRALYAAKQAGRNRTVLA